MEEKKKFELMNALGSAAYNQLAESFFGVPVKPGAVIKVPPNAFPGVIGFENQISEASERTLQTQEKMLEQIRKIRKTKFNTPSAARGVDENLQQLQNLQEPEAFASIMQGKVTSVRELPPAPVKIRRAVRKINLDEEE